jgi:hypothetical protein
MIISHPTATKAILLSCLPCLQRGQIEVVAKGSPSSNPMMHTPPPQKPGFSNKLAGIIASLLVSAVVAHADSLSFTDLIGDGIAKGDIVGGTLVFDHTTGSYTVTWNASAADPFSGQIILSLNLGNTRIGTPDDIDETLSENITLTSPTTTVSYSGVSPDLTLWRVGDTFTTSGSTFESGLIPFPESSPRDLVNATGVVQGVPDTVSTLPMLSLAIVSLFSFARRVTAFSRP